METLVSQAPPPTNSYLKDFWQKLQKNRMGIIGLVMLLVIILVAVFADVVAPFAPNSKKDVGVGDIYQPPSARHLLGTDDAGADVLSNFIHGARVSLTVGFFAAFISIFIGGMLGIVAGFFGGRMENLVMRFTDVMLVIPDR